VVGPLGPPPSSRRRRELVGSSAGAHGGADRGDGAVEVVVGSVAQRRSDLRDGLVHQLLPRGDGVLLAQAAGAQYVVAGEVAAVQFSFEAFDGVGCLQIGA